MAVKPQEKQYQSAYSTAINDLVNKAINREAFSYDPATDVAYQSYARQYQRLGDESARDTLADVSAQTGGLASSYAVTAAQQARNQYNQALTDKIPSLMEAAYQKYRDEYNDALAGASTLQGIDDSQYNRFATDRDYNRNVYTSDRDYERGVYESNRDFNENVRQYNQNYALDKQTADFERMLNTWSTMGTASKAVANYFGIPVGTKTNEAAYQAAQLALDKAKFAASLKGSGGGSGRSGGRRGRGGSEYQTSEQKYGKYNTEKSALGGNFYDALHQGSYKINNGASDDQLWNWYNKYVKKGLSSGERTELLKSLGLKKSGKNDYKQAKTPYTGNKAKYTK